MPVRSTIHSSVVSTVSASSALLTLALGQRRADSGDDRAASHSAASLVEGMRAEIVEVLADLAGDIVADHPGGDADGIGDALGVGAAVALHDQAVEAEEDGAVMVVRVEVDLEHVERRPATRRIRPWSAASW